MVLLWVLAQVAVFAARLQPGAPYPVSGRFSWSMFAGPLVGHCQHRLRVTRTDGTALGLPVAPHPLGVVLRAREPRDFSRAVELFAPYGDSDAALAQHLDALLGRWSRSLPPGTRIESALRCASPGWPPFSRDRTFVGGRP